MTGHNPLNGWALADRETLAAAVLRVALVVIIASWLTSNSYLLAGVGIAAFVAPAIPLVWKTDHSQRPATEYEEDNPQ